MEWSGLYRGRGRSGEWGGLGEEGGVGRRSGE